jgi:N-acetylmuramoyl-L-alanine amidase
MLKRSAFIFGIFTLCLLFALDSFAQYKVKTVVLDAGHGGRDPGALGSYSMEKDIALAIALKAGAYIEEYLPDVKVLYTRKDDTFVELHRRASIANDNEADLFISIHCNANRSSAPYGSETYVMGLHKSEANLEVAKLENAAILKEENYADMYQGFDPNQDEDYITLTMFQDAFLEQSTVFAKILQDQFRERVKIKDRGVKQAGFLVLHQTAMPGVLVETGFLSNPKDERFLNSEDGQTYLASAIYRAFRDYKNDMERSDNKAEPVEAKTAGEQMQETVPGPATEILFRVQIATYESPKPLNYKKFRDADYIMEYYHNGMFKYTAGKFENISEAVEYMNELKEINRFKDCFVVAFKDNKRISIEEARSLLKNR